MQLEGSSEGATSLCVDDEVELQLVTDFKSDKTDVKSLRLLCKSNEKRELGQVGHFHQGSAMLGASQLLLARNQDVQTPGRT